MPHQINQQKIFPIVPKSSPRHFQPRNDVTIQTNKIFHPNGRTFFAYSGLLQPPFRIRRLNDIKQKIPTIER